MTLEVVVVLLHHFTPKAVVVVDLSIDDGMDDICLL